MDEGIIFILCEDTLSAVCLETVVYLAIPDSMYKVATIR